MLSRLRRNPLLALLSLFVLVSLGLFVMFATGLGPDRRIRLALGLTVKVGGCTPSPQSVRNPPGGVGSWTAVASMPRGSDEIRAVGVGDLVVLGTGIDLVRIGDGFRSVGRMYSFDPARNRYAPLPDPPTRVDHPLLTADQDDVYLVGGYVDGVATAKAWRFSLATRRWSALPPMPTARGALGGAVIGERLYAVGGSPPTYSDAAVQPYGTLEILDLRTGRWETALPMRFPRHHLGVAALDGSLYVVGGRGYTRYALPYHERFDPGTRRWETLAPLPQGAGGLAAVALGEEVVAIGGGNDPAGWVTGATWAYEPGEDRWRRLPDLVHARHGHGAAAVGERAYVFGGAPCPGVGQSGSAEVLDVR
jgi:hypothetical protein